MNEKRSRSCSDVKLLSRFVPVGIEKTSIGPPGLDEIELAAARWGFIPHWWKEAKMPTFTINARFEEAATKPMWRTALRSYRCLIPAEGWYEWKMGEKIDPITGEVKPAKRPHFIHRKDGRPLGFAGLVSLWSPPDGAEPILSCSILTRNAIGPAAEVHDRMPVAFPAEVQVAWLDPALTDAARVVTMIRDCSMSDFEHYLVSTRVNSTRNEDEKLLEPIIL